MCVIPDTSCKVSCNLKKKNQNPGKTENFKKRLEQLLISSNNISSNARS